MSDKEWPVIEHLRELEKAATPPPASRSAAEALLDRINSTTRDDIWYRMSVGTIDQALAAAHLAGQLAMRERCDKLIEHESETYQQKADFLRRVASSEAAQYNASVAEEKSRALLATADTIRALDPEPMK